MGRRLKASVRLNNLVERCGLPGLALHQSIRKRLIAIQDRKYLDGPNNALMVIGGGLDSLALERSASGNQEKPSSWIIRGPSRRKICIETVFF